LHYGCIYWKCCFQNGSEKASGPWSWRGLFPHTPLATTRQERDIFLVAERAKTNTQFFKQSFAF